MIGFESQHGSLHQTTLIETCMTENIGANMGAHPSPVDTAICMCFGRLPLVQNGKHCIKDFEIGLSTYI